MNREEKLVEIFQRYPVVVYDKNRMRALLMDYFPEDKLLINLLMNAYDAEVLKEIDQAKVLNRTILSRLTRQLTEEYGLQRDKAEDIVLLYFRTYGAAIRRKQIDIKQDCSDEMRKTVVSSSPAVSSDKGNTVVAPKTAVKISSIPEGGKFPKSLLVKYPDEEALLGIQELTCTMRKKYWFQDHVSVELIGEVIGAPLDQDILIMAMAINGQGQMIGANYAIRIRQNEFAGLQTFSETLWVPDYESISEIRLRPMIDIVLQE